MSKINRQLLARIEAERSIELERYGEDGFESRFDYLSDLGTTHGLKLDLVLDMAELLGPDEDFDGLVCACEDAASGIGLGGGLT